ncbi:MAG TPA: acetate--CoA ligase family protein, partial [Acidimicrobiales bacterium]|nr:acetate--CoA ligase family protein [Acidimicrobiales bacterium]
AMVGASNNVTSIGGQVFANLARAFSGELYPVNPKDSTFQDRAAFPSVSQLPEAVDLAVVVVPAAGVPGVIEECAARDVGGALVITAGFAEAGAAGAQLQEQVAATARRSGLRVVGPNCIGYMNLFGGVMANFALPPTAPLPHAGPLGLVSQSGGFGSYIANKALLAGLRLGWFVSTGNEVDVNIAAVLRYLVERDETRVLLAFSETLRDPEVFIEAASRAAELDKPLVVLKAGRSDEAARAALSHTASIVGSARVFDAICRQYGVFVVRTMEAMLDLGMIFQDGRRVQHRGVGVMTTSGGAGVLLADACASVGLAVPELPQVEQRAMLELMPQPFYGSTTNPVDTTAQVVASPESFRKVLFAVGNSPSVDMLAPVTWAIPGPTTDALIEFYRSTDKPVAITSTAWLAEFQEAGVPTYTDPYRAANALGAVARQSLRSALPARPYRPKPDRARWQLVSGLLAEASGRTTLLESASKAMIAAYGIKVTRERMAYSVDEAIEAAETITGLVALKVMSYDLPHKTEVGGLRLGVQGPASVRQAYEAMLAEVSERAPDAKVDGVLVQEMVPARLELACGIQRDPVFGPIVAAGLGGTLVEILSETVLLRPPFDEVEARAGLSELLAGRLVQGGRGLDDREQADLANLMVALGTLALEVTAVVEVDVNPVRVANGVAVVADALVVLDRTPRGGSLKEDVSK